MSSGIPAMPHHEGNICTSAAAGCKVLPWAFHHDKLQTRPMVQGPRFFVIGVYIVYVNVLQKLKVTEDMQTSP